MIPNLPRKKEILPLQTDYRFGKSTQHGLWMYNQALDDCLPRIEYLEGLVEELGEALNNVMESISKNDKAVYFPVNILDKYTTYKREVNND